MSKFDYNAYIQSQQQKQTPTTAKTKYTKVEFLNKYLKKDGDYVVVRFPYTTTEDFDVVHVHNVMLPGYQYAQHIECTRQDEDPIDNCPLCKEGNKIVNRFLVKALAYIHEVDSTGKSVFKIIPVVWDRPFGYAQELANKINEYGDLKEQLFKIKRSGTGNSTMYSTDIVLNKSVYNPEIYKADFNLLESVMPMRLCVRSIDKWVAAKNSMSKEPEETVTTTTVEPVSKTFPIPEPVQESVQLKQPQQPTTSTTKRSYSWN